MVSKKRHEGIKAGSKSIKNCNMRCTLTQHTYGLVNGRTSLALDMWSQHCVPRSIATFIQMNPVTAKVTPKPVPI